MRKDSAPPSLHRALRKAGCEECGLLDQDDRPKATNQSEYIFAGDTPRAAHRESSRRTSRSLQDAVYDQAVRAFGQGKNDIA
jgi:hypothetical protein